MSFIEEVTLSLADVSNLINEFESKYGITTEHFLQCGSKGDGLPEDDVLMWEALAEDLAELKRMEGSLRHNYLSELGNSPKVTKKNPKTVDQLSLVA